VRPLALTGDPVEELAALNHRLGVSAETSPRK
jgi:hypothetical protein